MGEKSLEMSNRLERIPEEKETVENKVAQESSQEILNDILYFRAYFNKKDFITGLVFGLGNVRGTLIRLSIFYVHFSTLCLGPHIRLQLC